MGSGNGVSPSGVEVQLREKDALRERKAIYRGKGRVKRGEKVSHL